VGRKQLLLFLNFGLSKNCFVVWTFFVKSTEMGVQILQFERN